MRKQLTVAVSSMLFAAVAQAQEVTWAEVGPIFAQHCTGCHSGARAAARLDLSTHAGAMAGSARGSVFEPGDPLNSEVVKRLEGRSSPRMPLGRDPLSEAEIALVRSWVEAGMPEGAAASAAPQPAAAPAVARAAGQTWFQDVEPIFGRHCVSCHTLDGQMGGPPEGLRLDSYEAILAGAERVVVIPGQPRLSEVQRRIEGRSQPAMPFDLPPLSDADIALIRDWIADGARSAEGVPAPVPVGREVRFRGNLEDLLMPDDGGLALDGADVEDRPGPGEAGELRGSVEPDATIRVTRLRAR